MSNFGPGYLSVTEPSVPHIAQAFRTLADMMASAHTGDRAWQHALIVEMRHDDDLVTAFVGITMAVASTLGWSPSACREFADDIELQLEQLQAQHHVNGNGS